MNKIDAVIFDWAGTTVDYGCFAPVQAFVEVFRHFGVEPTMEEVREPMGMLKIDHIRTMLKMPRIARCWQGLYGKLPGEEAAQEMFGLFEDKLMQILDRFTELKPGVRKTVEELRARGIAVGSTTGYNDKMMEIVAPGARDAGYAPDCWFSPDSTGQKGRPYPYMIFRNMERLGLSDVRRVIKVGDTVSDIREGKNAGVRTFGVVTGSSELGLTRTEFETLPEADRWSRCRKISERFREVGADEVIMEIEDLLDFI